jgi:AcrR family transcriptional regulator
VYGESMDREVTREPLGRRARKKQRTRETILREGLELFLAQGFKETSVAQIAEAADIAASTFFLYFPSKEELLFAGHSESAKTIVSELAQRPASASTIDVLRELTARGTEPDRWGTALWDLRAAVIQSDPALAGQERARWAEVVRPALIESYAADIGELPAGVKARLLTAMTIGPLLDVGRVDAELEHPPPDDSRLDAKHQFLHDLFEVLETAFERFAAGVHAPPSRPGRDPDAS